MIALRHIATGELQFVSSLDGVNMTVWEETGDAVPVDLESRAYRVIAGVAQAVPPKMALLAFLRLWTAAETAAVYQSANVDMIQARTLTLAAPTIDLASTEVQAGVALAQMLGILTIERAARILAGLPPL
jgi:hypothetical protein